MLQYLSEAERNRFAQLQSKLAQLVITDSEQHELAALVGAARQGATARTQAVESIKKLITENGVGIELLFSAEAISKAAAALSNAKNVRTRKSAKPEPDAAKGGQVLIHVKLDKGAGAPSRYKKGQKLAKYVSRNFKALDAGGQLLSNLLQYATPEGQAYFATASGRAELEAFAAHIQKSPVAP